jgi:hypothetical protein
VKHSRHPRRRCKGPDVKQPVLDLHCRIDTAPLDCAVFGRRGHCEFCRCSSVSQFKILVRTS